MSKYAKRKDGNHNAIKAAFEAEGWTWIDMYQFPGQLDGEVIKQGPQKRFCVIRVEVKMMGNTLTAAEEKFIDKWPGLVIVAYTVIDSLWRAEQMLIKY